MTRARHERGVRDPPGTWVRDRGPSHARTSPAWPSIGLHPRRLRPALTTQPVPILAASIASHLLDEVNIDVHRDSDGGRAELVVRFTGGAISELTVPIKRRLATIGTDEDTIDLMRRLANHYPDAHIAGILNRQGRRTA